MKSSLNKSAFTLVELLVSISIIGIMSALSISAYPKFSDQISLSTDTYKMVAFFRETQIYGSSAIAPPGTKIVYAFEIDQIAGSVKRYQILSPTDNTSAYYLSNISLDSTALPLIIKPQFEISLIEGIGNNSTTTLTKAYAFFKRPSPEAKLIGYEGSGNSLIAPSASGITSFEKIEVSLRSKKTNAFIKKVVILQTGQMYVSDW